MIPATPPNDPKQPQQRPVQTTDSEAAMPRDVVSHFFANYELPGAEQFKQAQSRLLSPTVQVNVNSLGDAQRYQGPEGYFQSLDDWGKLFRTGPDFKVEVDPSPAADGAWKAHLRGTLTLTRGAETITVAPNQHQWTETFHIQAGRITQLSVDMNLDSTLVGPGRQA